jgi:hypothetical protein
MSCPGSANAIAAHMLLPSDLVPQPTAKGDQSKEAGECVLMPWVWQISRSIYHAALAPTSALHTQSMNSPWVLNMPSSGTGSQYPLALPLT